jgi:8-oxo-dGTP pyrophosphatase MutT (NUDIX family)
LHKRHGGLWEFPGGKTEPGESDDKAAERELSEELNVSLQKAEPPAFEVADPDSPYVIAFVPVEIRGEPSCTEHVEMTWRTAAELRELPLAPSDRAFVEFLLNDSEPRG